MSERFTRRQVLKTVGALSLLPILQACGAVPPNPTRPSPNPTDVPPRPDVTPTPDFGRPIEQAHLTSILEALKNSGYPLFMMISEQINKLHASNTKPSEYPDWVSNDSTGFEILTTDGQISNTILTLTFNLPDFNVTTKNNQSLKYHSVDYVSVRGASIGLSDYVRNEGPLVEGLFLAKEYITIMELLRMAMEFYEVMHPSTFRFSDINGKEVMSAETQALYGRSLFFNQAYAKNSDISTIADGLPKHIVGGGVMTSILHGGLPRYSVGAAPFYTSSNKLANNIEARKSIDEITANWVAANTLLPPPGLTLRAFSQPLFSATTDLQKELKLAVQATKIPQTK